MKVLLTGYTGFIGSRVLTRLVAAGHRVVCAGRRPPTAAPADAVTFVRHDLALGASSDRWRADLAGVEVAINAAGVIGVDATELEAVHAAGPIALFDACAAASVRRIVQVSALGADSGAATEFHATKRAADDHLRALPVEHVIVQPSLVYGVGGRSAALFAALASAPVTPLPGAGAQAVQPVHVDDVVDGIVAALTDPDTRAATVAFVGPEPLALRDFLAALRAALGLGRARLLAMPMPLVRLAARLGTRLRTGLLNDETLAMLARGNVGDPAPFARLLGRSPRPVREFVTPASRALERRDAQLGWLLPVLRAGIGVMWLVSGLVSLGLYPVAESLRLLAATGITTEWMAYAALFGAAAIDLAFGVAVFALRRRRALWAAQIAVVLAYTAIISVRLPELWLEPFGPVLKNLPVLAALWLLYATEDRRWST